MELEIWWNNPDWLKSPSSHWPGSIELPQNSPDDEQKEICLLTEVEINDPLFPLNCFSSFSSLTRATA